MARTGGNQSATVMAVVVATWTMKNEDESKGVESQTEKAR
jgi:hypothetical protein